MSRIQHLSEKEINEIEMKAKKKLGEKFKVNRILRDEVFELVQQEATLLKYPIHDNELCAFVCLKENRTFVYINTFIPREKQVFAAAHELYHIWYDKDRLLEPELLHNDVMDNETENINEQKANRFAALLLVPTDVLHSELMSRAIQKDTLSIEDVIVLMAFFYVPFKTMVRRLNEIDFIDQKKTSEFLSVPDRDPQAGVMLVRKRLQLNDSSQERTNEIFFEKLAENAIEAFDKKLISERKLRSILSLMNQSPESLQVIKGADEVDLDILLEDYDGNE
ncbi:ImmA/IrrE family metallo-endopeptidase [Aureibacillus halotolerans]|uniref:Uncharacterized protein DUF955 n=1 Tax=Aureibacillus halotolerans TaxID=1508390 RepID=A0A4R6U008_9BACI|nr:ImmA/IrrE family metallo-endopeptidase [Aureibacillus halotolerans]TDQ36384.1 uncharacterized protein DUF955 [Aureibacillus halotolerans]